ncbi:MAG: hypothetical protein JRI39_13525 [Deltaproteobacteria bacterium]|nr:hypothetical protein [Deltaproteobacteria bacterium]
MGEAEAASDQQVFGIFKFGKGLVAKCRKCGANFLEVLLELLVIQGTTC